MLFEVVKFDKVYFSTDRWDFVYDYDTLDLMSHSGYSFKIDGKSVTPKKIENMREPQPKELKIYSLKKLLK